MNWKDITLYKYQQIELINNNKAMEAIDKTLFSVCQVYNYTEFELDNLPIEKVSKMAAKVADIFSSEFKPIPVKRIGRYIVNYQPDKLTFGQYVELSYFLQGGSINNAHYILASITSLPFFQNNSGEHRKKSEYFLKQPITKVPGTLSAFIENFNAFNNEYKDLFGLDKETSGDVGNDFFNRRYGWIYSATCIAEHERIELDEVFKLPVRQALNDLSFLKAKAKYEAEQIKKNHG